MGIGGRKWKERGERMVWTKGWDGITWLGCQEDVASQDCTGM